MQKINQCFCGSTKLFSVCCQPFLSQDRNPATAEELMRSRYSAFNIGNVEYLIETLLPENRQPDDKRQIQETIDNTQWLGLKIIPELARENNKVEFVAFFEQDNNAIGQLHENSNFIQLDEKWFYIDGVQLPELKLRRNELCFCGSGKKFKKCHFSS